MYFVPTREPEGPTALRGDSIYEKLNIEVFGFFCVFFSFFSEGIVSMICFGMCGKKKK